jgi:hypothetical protein
MAGSCRAGGGGVKRTFGEEREMICKLGALVVLIAVSAGWGFGAALAQRTSERFAEAISTGDFRLISTNGHFALSIVSDQEPKRITIPRSLLIPPNQEKEDEEWYVSSFKYDEHLTSFPIGDGRIGLRTSSFALQDEGSAQAAAGRDVFMIYNPKSRKVRLVNLDDRRAPADLWRGLSKGRVRSFGCFSAYMVHFLVADINEDGLADVGTVQEELRCEERRDAHKGMWTTWKGHSTGSGRLNGMYTARVDGTSNQSTRACCPSVTWSCRSWEWR